MTVTLFKDVSCILDNEKTELIHLTLDWTEVGAASTVTFTFYALHGPMPSQACSILVVKGT